MSYDTQRQVLVVFGGRNGAAHSNETWEFDGTNWSNRSGSLLTAPSARANAEMAYDSQRNRVVLFGGHNGTGNLADTWEYDGADWVQAQPAASPPARSGAALTFDSIRRVVVMFGGQGDNLLNDTWEYDGSTWRQIFRVDVPSPRVDAKLAYDPSRFQAVLFGGETDDGTVNDTWIYDGTDWSLRTPANAPSARSGHAMTFDSSRNLILLFGGNDGADQNDSWVYDDATWALLAPAASPPARTEGELIYDSARSLAVLFGGSSADEALSDTWEFDGPSTMWSKPNSVESDILFDMSDRADGVWHYSSVHIPQGIRVTFRPNARNTPVTWLVSGDVTIDGELILDGADGTTIGLPGTEAQAGPGGGNGGLGGTRGDVSGNVAGSAGAGVGGGQPGVNDGESGGDAAHVSDGAAPRGGSAYGSVLLQPLSAGSGGGGGAATQVANGGGGGGGGGGLFIAVDGSLILNGSISARGGAPAGNGGKGSAGGVRLAATILTGNGQIDVGGDAVGRVRLEAFSFSFAGSSDPAASTAPPVLSPANAAQIIITDIAGQVAPAIPGGDLSSPDVVFEESGSVTIHLATNGLPEQTIITVRIAAAGQLIDVQSTPTDGDGNAIATATVPAGVGVISAYAEW